MNKPILKSRVADPATSPVLSLESWADSVFTPDYIDHRTNNLSRFGLQTAADVVAFLKSPAGEAIQAEIGEQLAIQESIKETQRQALQEHNLFTHRLRALLFLWFVENNAHAAAKIRDLIENQNQQNLKANEKAVSAAKKASAASHESVDPLSSYNRILNIINTRLDAHLKQDFSLQQEKEHIEAQSHRIETKYQEYNTYLDLLDHAAHGKANLDESEIDHKIETVTQEINVLAVDISKLLDDGFEEHARELLNKQNALNLQIGTLLDMKDVLQGKKYYADGDGDEVDSFTEAKLVLKKGASLDQNQKVIKADGKLYLLKPGQNWNDIKDSLEAKQQARQDYKHLKREVMSVKNVVQYNKGSEIKNQQLRLSEVNQKQVQNQAEILQLQNQITLVQAARAIAVRNLTPTLTPKPTPGSKLTPLATPQPSLAPVTVLFKEQLKLLKQATQLTKEDLLALAAQAPGANKKLAVEFLQREFTNLSRKASIPLTTMRRLLVLMEQFGVEPKKEMTPNRPSPFKTTPDPFGK